MRQLGTIYDVLPIQKAVWDSAVKVCGNPTSALFWLTHNCVVYADNAGKKQVEELAQLPLLHPHKNKKKRLR
ncbi:MAG: hypothetical protein OWS74_04355 [Firmicutes bacterium]|nr:hypothetical protein [Bacillota bacterium]